MPISLQPLNFKLMLPTYVVQVNPCVRIIALYMVKMITLAFSALTCVCPRRFCPRGTFVQGDVCSRRLLSKETFGLGQKSPWTIVATHKNFVSQKMFGRYGLGKP